MAEAPQMLAWNFPNWITVILMALAGYALLLGIAALTGKIGAPAAAPVSA